MILHLDLDCFFAAAHRIDNPSLHNIPIAVGGRSNLNIFSNKNQTRQISNIKGAFTSSILSINKNNDNFNNYFLDKNNKIRGIITTSSYEARAFGVKTAMSVSQALMYCPHLKVIAPNYPLYHDLSYKLNILLQKEVPCLEQFSIDEFFADVTGWIKDDDVLDFALYLKNKIFKELGLPISIGIAKTKWIAKLCTNDAKPNGIKLIKEKDVLNYIKNKPISSFPGIGKGYEKRLKKYLIKTLGDIEQNRDLFYTWGKNGIQLYNRICGLDNEKISIKQDKKSIGLGRTFDPINDRNEIRRRLIILCRHLSFLAYKNNYKPQTFSLKVRYEYSNKIKAFINTNRLFNELNLKKMIIKLFNTNDIHKSHNIIQINITLSNFQENKTTTLDLFNYDKDKQQEILSKSIGNLRDKFGIDIIKTANELQKNNT